MVHPEVNPVQRTRKVLDEDQIVQRRVDENVIPYWVVIVIIVIIIFNVYAFLSEDIKKNKSVSTIKSETVKKTLIEDNLHQAVSSGDKERLVELLDTHHNSNINNVNNGMTPIMLASSKGDSDVIKILLKAGANPNFPGSSNRTALQYAVEKNHSNCVRILLEAGADINGYDNSRLTPLIMAADRNYTDLAIYLIEQGADVNIQHKQGWTALIDAARNGNSNLVNALITAGADPKAQTTNGWSAYDYARLGKHTDVMQQLEILIPGNY